jgi:hypothetical protein
VTAFFNPWVLLTLVLAVAGAAGAGYYKGHDAGKSQVQAEWAREKAEQFADHAKRQDEARQREQQLQATADNLRQEKDREIRNLNARATALSNSMRDRPSRATAEAGGLSTSTGPGSAAAGCSGKELYRETAEDLVKLGKDADELRLALKQCYSQYQSLTK